MVRRWSKQVKGALLTAENLSLLVAAEVIAKQADRISRRAFDWVAENVTQVSIRRRQLPSLK